MTGEVRTFILITGCFYTFLCCRVIGPFRGMYRMYVCTVHMRKPSVKCFVIPFIGPAAQHGLDFFSSFFLLGPLFMSVCFGPSV